MRIRLHRMFQCDAVVFMYDCREQTPYYRHVIVLFRAYHMAAARYEFPFHVVKV